MSDAASTTHTTANDMCFGTITVEITSPHSEVDQDDAIMSLLWGLSDLIGQAVGQTVMDDDPATVDDDDKFEERTSSCKINFSHGDTLITHDALEAWYQDWRVRHADEIAARQAQREAEAAKPRSGFVDLSELDDVDFSDLEDAPPGYGSSIDPTPEDE